MRREEMQFREVPGAKTSLGGQEHLPKAIGGTGKLVLVCS